MLVRLQMSPSFLVDSAAEAARIRVARHMTYLRAQIGALASVRRSVAFAGRK